jgi:hypothetical protein
MKINNIKYALPYLFYIILFSFNGVGNIQTMNYKP